MNRSLVTGIAVAVIAVVGYFVFTYARSAFSETEYDVVFPSDVHCVTDGFPSVGSPEAPVKIVEYGDFECKYTPKMERVLDTLMERFGTDKVEVIYKIRPIHMGQFRRRRAMAAYAAHRQGKFFEMKEQLAAITISHDEKVREKKLTEDIRKSAETVGLDISKFETDMGSEEVEKTVGEVVAETEKYGITGFPSLFINQRLVIGVRASDYFAERIQHELGMLETAADSLRG